ncbi:unnamed protein product, partial [Allacma fusca]
EIVTSQEPQDADTSITPAEFAPVVTATCRQGLMTITVQTAQPFYGTIHPSSLRTSPCIKDGIGSNSTQISFNMIAIPSDPDYCGVSFNNRTGDKSVQIAVRAHRTLELAEDKQYVVTCGKAGFRNNRNNDTWTVRMGFYVGERPVAEVIYGRAYTLRVELSKSPEFAIRVRSCFSFGINNTAVPLVDDNGCPERGVISRWAYTANNQIAEATIYSMFRFQDSKRLNFQCDVLLCQEDKCPNPKCDSVPAPIIAIPQRQRDTNDTSVLAAVTVSVLDPGDKPELLVDYDNQCTGICPKWILWLAIVLGVLFLLMLLVNLFLCSALTCTCTRTELIEKEPSVLEDYDPYRSWAGSQYGGSRYSLNGGNKPIYSMSAESNGGSDHYATVPSRHSPSRPGSRYSNSNGNRQGQGGSPYSHNRKL